MPTVPRIQSIVVSLSLVLASCAQPDAGNVVRNIDEFDRAVAALQPGDELVLANGEWSDVELRFKANGLPEQPVQLTAEEPGKVIITGQSNLSISGSHLVVSGLVFKDGFTPTTEVIAFRTSKEDLANNVRVTNTVIDSFSNPERHSSDVWVAIYGKNNQFDHNTLLNKGNAGVTLAVKMNTEASRENGHIIEYNYFGPRQTLGSNGGETLRIGTSHYSREYSNTVVRKNYFDRTSGELEIISSKACGNEIRDNVFFESQGTLTMRHGHYTLVEGNYFLGNRKPNTGGIRIINENQTVRNNYLYGLTGHRFRGAMVIMNGVPNGPINRYDPVIDSMMNNNIVIDSDHIQLCAGSDEERSGVPTGSSMHNNIFMSKTNLNPFTVYDDISGISFEGNVLNEEADVPIDVGFSKAPYSVVENEHGLLVPAQSLIDDIEFGEVKLPVTKKETGADFYPKTEPSVAFESGVVVTVPPGTDTLRDAVESSGPGDTLVLENGGEYLLTKFVSANHPLTITAEDGDKPIIRSEKSTFVFIENGGALELENLWFDGTESPDLYGNNVISTSRYSMNRNYSLAVRNCKVTNLDVNHSFNFLGVYKATFADSIEISDTEMTNITGSILAFDKEPEDLGIYNVENVTITNSTFTDIQGAVANIYRGGTDESTFGPIVRIEANSFVNTGLGRRNKSGASLIFHGVQKLEISNSTWDKSAPLELFLTNGEPITVIEDVVMKNTGQIRANSDQYTIRNVTYESSP
ncbi:MAG: polysaccharide lyase 6 family protein [Woeseiaceae bacterium]|nr:polysaccharide lyase 6 family protein [Woeseiaceae bacterium]